MAFWTPKETEQVTEHVPSKLPRKSPVKGIAITLGALVIDLKLHAVLVAIHLGIGILLFAMVLLTTLFAFRLGKKSIQTKI
mgnify:CR=1 FL=1